MLNTITKALSGSTSPAPAPAMGILDRIAFIELRATEEEHAARGIYEASRTAQTAYGEAEGALAHLEQKRLSTPHASLEAMIKAQKTRLEHQRKAADSANTRKIPTVWRPLWEAMRGLADKVRDGTMEYTFDPAEPKMPKGTRTLVEAIAAVRAQRRDLVAEAPRVKGAVDPNLARRVAQKVNAEIEKPSIVMRESGEDFSITWPTKTVRAEPNTMGGIPKAHDAAALACWLNRDAIIAELTGQAEAIVKSADKVMNPADKRDRLRQIETELAELERQECALIWAALEAGEDVTFRPDTDPRAVLGIR